MLESVELFDMCHRRAPEITESDWWSSTIISVRLRLFLDPKTVNELMEATVHFTVNENSLWPAHCRKCTRNGEVTSLSLHLISLSSKRISVRFGVRCLHQNSSANFISECIGTHDPNILLSSSVTLKWSVIHRQRERVFQYNIHLPNTYLSVLHTPLVLVIIYSYLFLRM
jgi:hypothetical protein